jgi:signal transduction histidine kinase
MKQAADGEPLIFEWQHYRRDNTPFDSEVSMTCVTSDQQRFIIAIVRDISERKRIDKLKDDFISTVSHEIRTPLTSIRGSLGLIHGGVVGEIPEKAAALIEIAHNNTNRLLHLVNDLLDIQKLESGLSQFTIEPTNLKQLLEQAVEANNAYAASHQTTLLLSEVDKTLEVPMDQQRIMQVMNNLLSNAAKFSPPDNQVEIITEKRDNSVRITVIDQGPGVPEEFRPHLFERFTQADSSATRKTGGTGLGLSISKAIVEHHHGEISFERNQRGSCFYFTLPLNNMR